MIQYVSIKIITFSQTEIYKFKFDQINPILGLYNT